jgi:hypothetical protein
MLDTVLDSPPAARVLAASGVPGRLIAGAEAARRDLALGAPIHLGTVAADSPDTQRVSGRAARQQAAQPTVLGRQAPAGSWVTNWVTIALNTYGLRWTSEHKSMLMKTASRTGYRYTDIALQARGQRRDNRVACTARKYSNRTEGGCTSTDSGGRQFRDQSG